MSTAAPPEFQNKDKCVFCNAGFTLFHRKHHCRNCGSTVCGNCSPSNVPLPHFGLNEPVRVCNTCHKDLKAGLLPASVRPAQTRSAAAAPAAAAAPVASVVAATPAKKKNCTCNNPLCTCPAEAEAPAEKVEEKKQQVVRKPVAAQPTTQSSFVGFGFHKPAQVVYDLNGDLNEQLREAVKAGDTPGVVRLLDAGASPSYVDRAGHSILHLAAMFNRGELVDLLMSKGADPYKLNADKETPIDLAPPALQFKMKAKAGK